MQAEYLIPESDPCQASRAQPGEEDVHVAHTARVEHAAAEIDRSLKLVGVTELVRGTERHLMPTGCPGASPPSAGPAGGRARRPPRRRGRQGRRLARGAG